MTRKHGESHHLQREASDGSDQASRTEGEENLCGVGIPSDPRYITNSPRLAASSNVPCVQDRSGQDLRPAAEDGSTDDLVSLKEAAAEGAGEAQKLLGERYLVGRGVERDLQLADTLLSRAAKQNVPGAEELLQPDGAFLLRRKKLMLKHVNLAAGLGSPGDLEFLHQAAEEDLGEAQQLLGEMYLTGNGVSRDCLQAAMWLSRAAVRKGAGTSEPLGTELWKAAEHRNPRDLEFLLVAAKEGVAEAQKLLGELYLTGNGVPRDCLRAAMWLSRAAMRKGPGAEALLQQHLRRAVQRCDPEDLNFLQGAAAEGVTDAQHVLEYLNGKKNPQRDYRQAAKWLSSVAKRNASGTAELLQQELQYAAEQADAHDVKFLTAAAEEGVGEAQKLLGEMYICGRGVSCDYQMAIKWLRGAVSCNEPGAKDLLQEAKDLQARDQTPAPRRSRPRSRSQSARDQRDRGDRGIEPPIGPRPTPRPGAGAQAYPQDWNFHNRKR